MLFRSIAAYLPKARFYYINRGEYGSFTSWKSAYFGKMAISWEQILFDSKDISPAAYILPLNSKALPGGDFESQIFGKSIMGDDYQIVYRKKL